MLYRLNTLCPEPSSKLLARKSRVAPKNLSPPSLKLVAAHIFCKVLNNIRKALHFYNFKEVSFWVDSITVVCWIKSKDTWSTLVRKRALEIGKFDNVNWHFVLTKGNLSDLGSRGVLSQERITKSWLYGPEMNV